MNAPAPGNGSPVLGADGALPEGDTKYHAVEGMFDRLAPRYDRMNRVISLGMDKRWRRHTVDALRRGAWRARARPRVRHRRPVPRSRGSGARPVGVDFSAGMLANARTSAPLVRADGARLPAATGALDGITCGFALRNFVDLDAVFRECARALRPGGRFAALDATVPANPVMRLGNAVWFRGAVPLLGRVLAGDGEAYSYLPKSTAYLPAEPELVDRLRLAGFTNVEFRTFTGGSVLLLTGTRA